MKSYRDIKGSKGFGLRSTLSICEKEENSNVRTTVSGVGERKLFLLSRVTMNSMNSSKGVFWDKYDWSITINLSEWKMRYCEFQMWSWSAYNVSLGAQRTKARRMLEKKGLKARYSLHYAGEGELHWRSETHWWSHRKKNNTIWTAW